MRRSILPIVALCCVFSLAAVCHADPAPAAPSQAAESVADMKARLAKLKEEAAALEAKIAAAEAPAPGTDPAIITELNAMPKNLWPADSDTAMKQSLRDKWLDANIKPGTTYDFTGLVSVVSPYTINAANKAPVAAVMVVLDCGKHTVWGKEKGLRVMAVLENVKPEDTLDWGDKKTITITGKSKSCRTDSSPTEVQMETSKLK